MRGSKQVSFVNLLAPGAVSRVRFVREHSEIIEFVVQLECLIHDEWRVIVRYDTAHGFAHRDLLNPDGSQEKTELSVSNYNEALTFAQLDLKTNWQLYWDRYERQMKE